MLLFCWYQKTINKCGKSVKNREKWIKQQLKLNKSALHMFVNSKLIICNTFQSESKMIDCKIVIRNINRSIFYISPFSSHKNKIQKSILRMSDFLCFSWKLHFLIVIILSLYVLDCLHFPKFSSSCYWHWFIWVFWCVFRSRPGEKWGKRACELWKSAWKRRKVKINIKWVT